MSVLLVTFDALRADAFDERITPSLVALARGAVVFARAYSPSAHTKPVMASIFASRPVADVMPADGRYENGLTVGTTLAQHMAAASRHTAAFNTFILDPETQAGFADYNAMNADAYPHGVHRDLSSASFTNGALAFVSNPRAEPFFVWVHYPDAHAPYLGPGPEGPNLASQRRAYHRTVAYVDRQLGRLLGGMQHLGLLDRTIVVVASDHGEELGRRGREGHGANVFEESIHVPLVLAAPGCGPLVVEQPVSLAGLGPSLGALMGIPIPGVGLLDSDLPVVAETPYDGELRRAVVRPHAKLIHDVRNGGRMLFDLAHDAGEVHNIYGSSSALTEQLEADYQRWLDRPGGR